MELFASRDLDSRLNTRELAAVEEFEESGRGLHTLRDHPYHTDGVPMVGGCWGSRVDGRRHLWEAAWKHILADPLTYAERGTKGPDQKLLTRHVWPWAKLDSLQHGSYKCAQYPGTIGFPTRRERVADNYMASAGDTMWVECPLQCRRYPNWTHC